MEFRGYSHYNAMELTLRQQVTHGLAVFSALTVQHSYGTPGSPDPYNFSYGYGVLSITESNGRLRSSTRFPPAGRGRRFSARRLAAGRPPVEPEQGGASWWLERNSENIRPRLQHQLDAHIDNSAEPFNSPPSARQRACRLS